LTSALDGGDWSVSLPGRCITEETALGTPWRGGWVGRRASLVIVEKKKNILLLLGIETGFLCRLGRIESLGCFKGLRSAMTLCTARK
jgi:hypothetical protein